jgi:putative flippase GtrA
MIQAVRGAFAPRYIRYVLASAGALGVDFALFGALVATGMGAAFASAIGYSVGVFAHWGFSSRAVFLDGTAERGAARRRQQALFLLSALAGLAITVGIVGVGTAAGLDPRLAKIAAIGVSFQATYLLRRHIVFAR